MRVEPTERALHLNRAGLGLLALGLLSLDARLALVGAAVLFGVGAAKSWALLAVARARAAGFEMSWQTGGRALRCRVGDATALTFRLSNHGRQPLRFADLEVLRAPGLEVELGESAGEIAAGSLVDVRVVVRARRVGFHGVHGLWVRAVQAPGLFDVPLSFTSPLVLEVLPKATPLTLREPRLVSREGHADAERHERTRGEGGEFLALREHQPGDPFRKIAWKASARRGQLLVIEQERERRESVWILLDASLEAAAGHPGEALLDRSIEQAARLARHHLDHGDRVGLVLVGARELGRVPLGRGAGQQARILRMLAHTTHTADEDRSDWDELEVRSRVVEHARGLDARAHLLDPSDRAAWPPLLLQLLERAPVHADSPRAASREDRLFRRYLLSFGVQPPPLGSSDRIRAERELGRILASLTSPKPRPSLVHIVSRWPSFETPRQLFDALGESRRLRVPVRFHALAELVAPADDASDATRLAYDALHLRAEENARWAERELTRLGTECIAHGDSLRSPTTTNARSTIRRSSTLTRTFQVPSGA
ncbi:MAG TPA: DUF58 domain-containing protein [Polyangiaceae bacterium]|nr:DUF58 domain-containing protein [Polyangiaceae bacterium]